MAARFKRLVYVPCNDFDSFSDSFTPFLKAVSVTSSGGLPAMEIRVLCMEALWG
jgi:hypothetical protein